ncbi:hypothetical protein SCLCIDRAFT_468628 [Scleroderma citrinum Foug A]|uniref:Uncharacterized protein n=1 Tax=Scleroderma citrinum Foug A TaxID=1036808 RepID=A0A0C3EBS3_9AGAM|nr:hypothetical protein SCLCIDRAFT_468628 [Scleroderma citrinum Foug A]
MMLVRHTLASRIGFIGMTPMAVTYARQENAVLLPDYGYIEIVHVRHPWTVSITTVQWTLNFRMKKLLMVHSRLSDA